MTLRLCIAIFATFLAGSVFAHSQNQSTTPADGAQIAQTPEMIHMVFDDPMRITMMRLTNENGVEMALDRNTGLDPVLEFYAEPGPLMPGRYTVEWRGLSSDGHAMQGRFSFELVD